MACGPVQVPLRIRVGIHSGPAAGGVVGGTTMPKFNLYGACAPPHPTLRKHRPARKRPALLTLADCAGQVTL